MNSKYFIWIFLFIALSSFASAVDWVLYDDCADDDIAANFDQPFAGAEPFVFNTDHYEEGGVDDTNDYQISRKVASGSCIGLKVTHKDSVSEGNGGPLILDFGNGISTTSPRNYQEGYMLYYYGDGLALMRLYKVTGGAATQIGGDQNPAYSDNKVVEFYKEGGNVIVKYDSNTIFNETDATYTPDADTIFMAVYYTASTTHNSLIEVKDIYEAQIAEENTPPSVYLVSPENDTITNDNTPGLTWYFTDAEDATADCKIFVNGTLKNQIFGLGNNTNETWISGVLADGNYTWQINCSDDEPSTGASEVWNFIIDTIDPTLKWTTPADDNSSAFVYGTINSLKIKAKDNNLYSFYLNITNSTGSSFYNFSNTSLTGLTSYIFLESINMTTWDTGTYTANATVCDGHTGIEISDWIINKTENSITYNDDFTITADFNINKFDTVKKKDRYNFIVETSQQTDELEFIITSNNYIDILNTEYASHLVTGRYWIDFNSKGITSSFVTRIDDNTVKAKLFFAEESRNFIFESAGELNCINESKTFQILIPSSVAVIIPSIEKHPIVTLAKPEYHYLFAHTNNTLNITGSGIWRNITFDREESLKSGITHNHTSSANDTFTITKEGIYDISYQTAFEDTAPSPDGHIEVRLINNGAELHGSALEEDSDKQYDTFAIGNGGIFQLNAGDKIKLQFTSDDTTVSLKSHHAYAEHGDTAVLKIIKIT